MGSRAFDLINKVGVGARSWRILHNRSFTISFHKYLLSTTRYQVLATGGYSRDQWCDGHTFLLLLILLTMRLTGLRPHNVARKKEYFLLSLIPISLVISPRCHTAFSVTLISVLSAIKCFILYLYSVYLFLEANFTEVLSLRWTMNASAVN